MASQHVCVCVEGEFSYHHRDSNSGPSMTYIKQKSVEPTAKYGTDKQRTAILGNVIEVYIESTKISFRLLAIRETQRHFKFLAYLLTQ